MRRRHIWHNGDWLDVTDLPRRPRVGPYIIRDCMDAAVHPATGETMDSKSAFRAATRAAGLVEIGNDAIAPAPPAYDPADLKGDVAKAITMLEQGYVPPPVETAAPDTRIFT